MRKIFSFESPDANEKSEWSELGVKILKITLLLVGLAALYWLASNGAFKSFVHY